jgi:hypothetical protein
MSRARLFTVGLLAAAFAMGAVTSATALAVEGPTWLVNNAKLEAGETRKADGKGTLSFVVNTVLKIECGKLSEKMNVLGGEPGKDEDSLAYSECTVVIPAACKAKEPITLETDTTLVFLVRAAAGEEWKTAATKAAYEAGAEKRLGDEFKPKVGETIGTITLEGCASEGAYKIQGSYIGIVNNGLEFTKESSNNKIKMAGKAGYVFGFMEYAIVNGAGEATGEAFGVSP